MRPAGVSITNEHHSALLRSVNPRADQWRVGTSVTATSRPAPRYAHASRRPRCGSPEFVVLHDGVVAERRDHARAMRGVQARERLDVDLVVVAMRDQHHVNGWQRLERDAGIVDAHGPEEAHR